ncbi:MAG TPA: RNA polymerase sigma factor [Methylocella sp.]|nr:RNA polymerase sigma factor [Methylocella sp.]
MFDNKRHFISELFQRHKRETLFYLARRVGPDHAPDLLQDAFLRILRSGVIAEVADPPAYLRRIARNLATDFCRRRKIEMKFLVPDEAPEQMPSEEPLAEELIESNQRKKLLASAIESLPPRCREVFVMRMHEDVPQDEIARRLGITRNMVDRHLRVAIARCRLALE